MELKKFFFSFHYYVDLIPLCMVVHLKFNLRYDLLMKYTIKNASGVIICYNAS